MDNVRARGAERSSTDSIQALLAPRSIAVIGASADPTKFSGRFIRFLTKNGYAGAIYPINARRDEVMGLRCYPDLAAIPADVDCVVYTVGAEGIGAALAACEAKAVKLVVVTSTGFAERGDAVGQALEAEVTAFARRTGIRVLGPNCVGFANFVDGVTLAAAAVLDWPEMPRGSIGLASQSGGLSFGTMMFNAFEEEIGFSYVVSTGNEADLDVVDFARFFVADRNTHVIALTIEAVRDGDAFRMMLEQAGRARKPVVVLKTGRSALGQTMAASHTGALAGSDIVFDAVCARYGVTRVDDVDELIQIAQMFAKLRIAGKLGPDVPPPGSGCSGLSISGGHVGHLADLGAQRGLHFPVLANSTQALLREHLDVGRDFLNPLDLSGGRVADHAVWGKCLAALLSDPAVRLGVPVLTIARDYDVALHDIIRVASEHDKIVLVVWAGGAFEGAGKSLLRRSDVPLFATSGRAITAIHALDRFCAAWSSPPAVEPARQRRIDPSIRRAWRAGRVSLGERESKAILAELGFPVAREVLATTAASCVAAAVSIGYPVAAKGEHPDIQHKTEAGIVRLSLTSAREVEDAFHEIERRMRLYAPGRPATGVIVQEMVPPGTELVLGAKRDETFGPVVMFGVGGVFVEVMNDVAFCLAPLRFDEALAMIRAVRGVALLEGARGRHRVDLDHLARLVVALGDFATAHAELIDEIDLNPLIAIDRAEDNLRLVDALILLRRLPAGMPEGTQTPPSDPEVCR